MNTQPQDTLAERIADRLNNDGTRWATDAGLSLDEMAFHTGAYTDTCTVVSGDDEWSVDSYLFPDGSRIGLVSDNAWDVLDRYATHTDDHGRTVYDLDNPLPVAR